LPAAYSLWTLHVQRRDAPRPDAYSLRQLNRRNLSPTDLSSTLPPAPDTPGFVTSPQLPDSSVSGRFEDRMPPVGGSTMRPSSEQYFRTPRKHSSYHNTNSIYSRDSSFRGTDSPGPSLTSHSTRSSSSQSKRESANLVKASHGSVSIRDYESQVSRPSTSENDSMRTSADESAPVGGLPGKPLGPRWNDYSFRESDLIYKTPRARAPPNWDSRVPSLNIAAGPSRDAESLSISEPKSPLGSIRTVASGVWSTIASKGQLHAPAERGFQVSRPGNPGGFNGGAQAASPIRKSADES
jgi:hypothetical protein